MSRLSRSLLPLLPFAALLMVLALPGRAQETPPPKPSLKVVDQATLGQWWKATNTLWLADTAYRVDGTSFEDGVCSYRFDEGIFIPVYNGKAPVAERQVGVVFVGKGSVSLSFPEGADAHAFGNHFVRQMDSEPDEMRAIAAGEAPFETAITRGMILSADPRVETMLYDLEPVGGGVMYRENDEEGVDAEYVVTEERGKLRAKVVATNLLPNRRNELVRLGLDPVAMLRQDRLLGGELGFPGDQLRLVADFQTETRFGVAAQAGGTLGANEYDRWLTCYRDGLGQSSLGYHDTAFTFGRDNDGNQHFQRLSGRTWTSVVGADDPRPPVRMEPVHADIEIEARPANFFSNEQHAKVESTIKLKAVGGDQRHVVMSLPSSRAVQGSWKLKKLSTADGRPLPWVALTADLAHRDVRSRRGGDRAGRDEGASADSNVEGTGGSDDAGTSGGTEATVQTSTASEVESQLGESVDIGERGESRALYSQTERSFEIVALLPEPVAEGEEVELQLDWEADWQYANWSYQGRPLGTTTGFQPVLPEFLPELYENAWDFHLKMAVPGVSLRTFSVAASGDTIDKWEDMDSTGRRWVETEGTNARDVGVAIGQWKERDEQAASGMPAVSVHLFFQQASALGAFPPEVRRVVAFLERFLPSFPQKEVEIFQGASTFSGAAMRAGFYSTAYGLVGVTTVKQYTTAGDDVDVAEASTVDEENPHLAQYMVARQVAHQYFGQSLSPATERDRWLERALSDAYAMYYVRAAIGKDPFDERLEIVRHNLEEPTEREETYGLINRYRRPFSLTGATYVSDIPTRLRAEYGFYFLAHMLRRKVGDQPYFLAIDNMAENYAGKVLTTERFQEIMENASGQDLEDYFDYWVHAAAIPELGLQVRMDEQDDGTVDVHGCLHTDIPFGTFEAPVQILHPPTGRIVAGPVEVTDGLGAFDVGGWKGEPELELDPERLILAYGRKIDHINGPSKCEEAAPPPAELEAGQDQ